MCQALHVYYRPDRVVIKEEGPGGRQPQAEPWVPYLLAMGPKRPLTRLNLSF